MSSDVTISSYHFPELRSALFTWAAGAAAAAKAANSGNGLGLSELISAQVSAIYALAEWDNVRRVVESDDQLRRQIGHAVGSVLWTQTVELENIGAPFLNAMLLDKERTGTGYELDTVLFDSLYGPIDVFLGRDYIEYEGVAPLVGLDCENAPIELGDDISIELLGEQHRATTNLELSLLRIAYSQLRPSGGELAIPRHYRHGVVWRFSLPKIVDGEDSEEATRIYLETVRLRDCCIRAIAAAQTIAVIPWPPTILEVGWRTQLSVTLGGPQMIWRLDEPGAILSDGHKEALLRAWKHVSSARFDEENASISLALARLGGLGTRLTIEDRFLDVMIAYEAFFSPPGSHVELKFRLASHAAVIGDETLPEWGRRVIYDFMAKAYDVRSTIVHGDKPSRRDLRYAGRDVNLAEFVVYASEVVRSSIDWAFKKWKPGENIAIAWNDLLFGKSISLGDPEE